MNDIKVQSEMIFNAETTKINDEGFVFKLASGWELIVGRNTWSISDGKKINKYDNMLSVINLDVMYSQFKSRIKAKRSHRAKIKVSIIKFIDGLIITTIDLSMYDSHIIGNCVLVAKQYRQSNGDKVRIFSYGQNSKLCKVEPDFIKDAELGDKAQLSVIKLMIRELCGNSLI
jgi:hypothetical protein